MISDTVYFKHKYITVPTVSKADMVIQAAKELMKVLEKNLPSAAQVMNEEALKRLAAIYDDIAWMKIAEKGWEEPASPRMLEDSATPRVTEPVPSPPVEPLDRLIVTLVNGSGVVESSPAQNT